MSFIRFDKVAYRYAQQIEPLFTDITFALGPGERAALVGANGTGKSTLIKLLLGQVEPTAGAIIRPSVPAKIGYLPQDLFTATTTKVEAAMLQAAGGLASIYTRMRQLEQTMTAGNNQQQVLDAYASCLAGFEAAGGWELLGSIEKAVVDAGLEPSCLQRPLESLSGGEKTRVLLAALQAGQADLLVLDEPSNHLDMEMISSLEQWLVNCGKAVLFVSHDRVFIDSAATKTIWLKHGQARLTAGGYSTALKNQQELDRHQQNQWEKRQALVKRLKHAADKRLNWAKGFQAQTTAEGGAHKFEMVTNPARTMTQQAKHIQERVKMLETRHPVEKPFIDKVRHISFEQGIATGKTVVTVTNVCFSWGTKPLLTNINLLVQRGQRIRLAGPNGCGKTTLLNIIRGKLTPTSGTVLLGARVHIGCYDQEHELLNDYTTPRQFLMQQNADESLVRSRAGSLFLDSDLFDHPIASLSHGEKSKLVLAGLLLGNYNLLVLDEPVNHLDLPAREALEEALQQYPGTVLFVSHDRAFIKKLAAQDMLLF